MAGKGRHPIGAVSRETDDAICFDTETPVLLPSSLPAFRSPRTRHRRPDNVRYVPSVIASQRRECVARCLASVVSRITNSPFAGPQALIIGISQARGAAVSLNARQTDRFTRLHRQSSATREERTTRPRTPHSVPSRLHRVVRVPLLTSRYSACLRETGLPTSSRITFCPIHIAMRSVLFS